MDAGQISLLLKPYLDAEPSSDLLKLISAYVDIMLKWNFRVNLTSIRDSEELVRRHFGESLFAARMLLDADFLKSTLVPSGNSKRRSSENARDTTGGMNLIDVGSGAGFPGMVLKLYDPRLRLTLIESHGKKATFLREVVRALGLKDVDVVETRAERFSGQAELVTMRAVEKFSEVLPVAASLVSAGGRLGIMVGSGQMGEASNILPGLWRTVSVPESTSRVLAVWVRS